MKCYLQAWDCVECEKGEEACRAGLGDAQQYQVFVQESQVCLCRGGLKEIQRWVLEGGSYYSDGA